MPGGWRPCQGSLCCCGGSPGCVAGNQPQPARGSSACSSSAVPAAAGGSGGFVFLICLSPRSSLRSFPASASLARVHRLIRTRDVAPGIFIRSCYHRSRDVPGTLPSHVQGLSPVSRSRRGGSWGPPKDSSHVWSPPGYLDTHQQMRRQCPRSPGQGTAFAAQQRGG